MNAIYFAAGCIIVILAVYWGSAAAEPTRLTWIFGQRPPEADKPASKSPFKRGR